MSIFNRIPRAPVTAVETLRAELVKLRQDLEAQSTVLQQAIANTDQVNERVGVMNTQISHISTEIGNQIHELGTEIGALVQQIQQSETVSAESLQKLQESQTRLANEQARYEIAFRQDLATLADLARRKF